jgi:hypothetical protein
MPPVPLLPPVPISSMPLPVNVVPVPVSESSSSTTSVSPAVAPARVSPVLAQDSIVLSARAPADWEAWRESRSHEVWYGWQTLAADASAAGVFLLGTNFRGHVTPFALASVGIYGAGPVAVHIGHGSIVNALGSAMLRTALALGGFGLGYCLNGAYGGPADGAMEAAALGGIAGGAIAAATDAALLGWDRWQGPERFGRVPTITARSSF